MTYEHIFEWIESNYDFELDESVDDAFDTISRDFQDDIGRPLENIIGDEKAEFLERLADIIRRSDVKPKADEDIIELQERADSLESRIDEISSNVAGRIEEAMSVMFEIIPPEVRPAGILSRLRNFFRGIFS